MRQTSVIGKGGRYEVMTDGRTVWVNSPGICVGRFTVAHMDIHQDLQKQLETAKSCDDCREGPFTEKDWQYFRDRMREMFGVNVPDNYAPEAMR